MAELEEDSEPCTTDEPNDVCLPPHDERASPSGEIKYDVCLVFLKADEETANKIMEEMEKITLNGKHLDVRLFNDECLGPDLTNRPYKVSKAFALIFIVHTDDKNRDLDAKDFDRQELISEIRIIKRGGNVQPLHTKAGLTRPVGITSMQELEWFKPDKRVDQLLGKLKYEKSINSRMEKLTLDSSGASKSMLEQPAKVLTPFFTDSTVALIVSGWGNEDTEAPRLKKNQEKVEELLKNHCKICNLFMVKSSGATRQDLLQKLTEIRDICEKDDRNFLFYYIGHNFAEKGGFKLDNNDNRDDIFKHDVLKEELSEVKSKHKLFILDTCYAGGVRLKEGGNEDASFLFGDIALGGDNDEEVKITWFSSAPNEISWLGSEIGYFTGAIKDVLTNTECDKAKCRSLRLKYSPGRLVPIDQLHRCVKAHLTKQMPGYECNKGEEGVKSFPAFPLS